MLKIVIVTTFNFDILVRVPKKCFLQIICLKHWRENFSVDFNQICNKPVNYRPIDAGKNFFEKFENQSRFWPKNSENIGFQPFKNGSNGPDQIWVENSP